jgi:hypothetical protein
VRYGLIATEEKTERFEVHLGASILKTLDGGAADSVIFHRGKWRSDCSLNAVLLTAQQLLHVSSAKEAGARQPKWQAGKSIASATNP